MVMHKFPSIEQFRNVKRAVEYATQYSGKDEAGVPILNLDAVLPTLKFKGTEKIHGSNCSIYIDPTGEIICQSRERVIKVGDDNYGFASFINNLPPEIINHWKETYKGCVIAGEWAGQGIQDVVAVSKVPKFWVIFAAWGVDEIDEDNNHWIDVSTLKHWNESRIFNITQVPTFEIEINFNDPVKIAEAINQINQYTIEVEALSPLGKLLGVEGIGEGIVWTPTDSEWSNSRYRFKTKGEKHSESKVTKLADVDVEKVATINELVSKVVEEGRLIQAWNWLKENNKEQTEKSTGDFIRWVNNDIAKEESDLIAASSLNVKDISGVVSTAARKWFFNKMK